MNRKLLLFICLCLCAVWSQATDFTYYGYDHWNTEENWTPYYPGTYIGAGDHVVMNGLAETDGEDIVIDGTLSGSIRLDMVNGGSVTINGSASGIYFFSYADVTFGNGAIVSDCDIYMANGSFYNAGTMSNCSLDLWGGQGLNDASGIMHLHGGSNQYGGKLVNGGLVDILANGVWDYNVLNGLTNIDDGIIWFRTGSTLRIFQNQDLGLFHFEPGITIKTRGNPDLTADWVNETASNFWIGEGDCCGDNRVSFTGNFNNEGTFTADLRGTNSGEYANLTASGAFVAGGKLVINRVNNFMPAAGGFTFVLVNAASVSGTFSEVQFPAGWIGSVSYNNPAGTVRVFVQPVTVTTGVLAASSICGGSAINVPFTASGIAAGNIYTAQLSDATGSFASPTVIGTLSSSATSGSISATISGNTASGTGYRIRVVASNPATIGTDNGSDVSIQNPLLTSISYPGTPFCAGNGTAPVFFSGINGGAYTSNITGLAIDATSGSVDIGASQPGLYQVTYTVTGSCTATATTQVAVRPAMGLPLAPPNQTVCAGTTITPTFAPITGFTYTWTNSNPSIGLAAGGNGLPGTFTTTNSSDSTAQAYIRLYIAGGTGCSLNPVSFCVRVKPVPVLNSVASQTLCAGAPASAITFSGNISGSTNSWTNSNNTIGLNSAGTGNIPSFLAANPSATVQTANLQVTPTVGGCSGVPVHFSIQVSPSAGTIAYPQASYCPAAWAYVTRHGSPGGTYSTSPAGLALNTADGSINLAASAAGTYNITYTVAATGACAATASTVLTVKAKAGVDPAPNQVVCGNGFSNPVTPTGNAGGYSWTITDSSGILHGAFAGTGTTVPAFATGVNNGATPLYAYVKITALASATLCAGSSSTFRIAVKPAAQCASITQSGGNGADAISLRTVLQQAFEVGPNPARSLVLLQYRGNEAGPFAVQLVSQYGTPVGSAFTFTGNTHTLDLSNLTPGAYSLQVTHLRSGVTFNKQVIKL